MTGVVIIAKVEENGHAKEVKVLPDWQRVPGRGEAFSYGATFPPFQGSWKN
jgi:hypothetical protein